MKLKTLFLILIVSVILPLTFSVFYYLKYQVYKIKNDAQEQITTIANLKINQIVNWDKERYTDAKIISQDPFFINDSIQWSNLRFSNQNILSIKKRLKSINLSNDYYNILILDEKGGFLFSSEQESEKQDTMLTFSINRAVKEKKVLRTELYRNGYSSRIHLDYIAPILGKKNQVIAIIIFRVDPYNFLYPLVNEWPSPSKTSETIIVKKEGNDALCLNEIKRQKNSALTYRTPISKEESPSVQAVLGYRGVFEGKNYKGVDVLSYIAPIPNTPWVMVAKVDKSEIYENLYFRERVLVSVIIVLIFIAILTISLFYNRRQSRIYKQLFIKEKELSERHQEFRTTLYSIGDGVITTDSKGLIKQMNPIAEELTGWKESEALGKKLLEIYNVTDENTNDIIDNPVELVLKKGEPVTIEEHFILTSKQGNVIPIADCGSPIKDEKGNVEGVVLVFRDQTNERFTKKLAKARLDLIEFAANHSLEEFLQKAIDEVCILTKSPIGFYHFVNIDQKTLTLQAWSTRTLKEYCRTEGKGLHYNIDEAGVWTDCVKERRPIIHNDYQTLENKKGLPQGHAPLIRELVVPIIRQDKVFAILGVGNKEDLYTERDIEIVSFLSDVAWEITKRKRAEEETKLNEARLKRAEVASKVGNWELHLDSNTVVVSEGARLVYGLTDEETIYDAIKKIPLPEYRPALDAAMENLIKNNQPYDLEFMIKTSAGEIKDIHSIAHFDKERNTVFGIIQDVTKQKQEEKELAVVNRQNQLILDSAAEGILGLDLNGVHTFINKSALEMLGYSENELLEKSSHSLWHHSTWDGNDYSEKDCLIYSTLRDGKSHSTSDEVFWRKDGTFFPVSYSTNPIYENEKLIGAVVTFTDITDKKRIENEIKEQETFVINLLEILPIPVFYKNVKGEYINVNKSFTRFFGKTKEELNGLTVFNLYPKELAEFYYQKDNELFNNPGVQIYESKYVNSLGNEFDVIVHKVVFRNQRNEIAGLVGAILDITEIKQSQNNLIMLNHQLEEINKTKDKMISIISHDLRSPFMGIIGFIELLSENIQYYSIDKTQNIIQMLYSTSKWTYDLLENLLNWAKSQTGQIAFKPSSLELQPIIDNLVKASNSISSVKDIKVIYSCLVGTLVYADKDMLSLVLRNLITNAIKFTNKGGTVEVRVIDSYNYVTILVKDDGVGMDEDTKSRLFKLDEKVSTAGTNNEKGSGLGLILCKEFTEMNKGTIEFESTLSKGTTFILKFPKQSSFV